MSLADRGSVQHRMKISQKNSSTSSSNYCWQRTGLRCASEASRHRSTTVPTRTLLRSWQLRRKINLVHFVTVTGRVSSSHLALLCCYPPSTISCRALATARTSSVSVRRYSIAFVRHTAFPPTRVCSHDPTYSDSLQPDARPRRRASLRPENN